MQGDKQKDGRRLHRFLFIFSRYEEHKKKKTATTILMDTGEQSQVRNARWQVVD